MPWEGPFWSAKVHRDKKHTHTRAHTHRIKSIKQRRFELSGSYTVSPTCSALRAVVRMIEARRRESELRRGGGERKGAGDFLTFFFSFFSHSPPTPQIIYSVWASSPLLTIDLAPSGPRSDSGATQGTPKLVDCIRFFFLLLCLTPSRPPPKPIITDKKRVCAAVRCFVSSPLQVWMRACINNNVSTYCMHGKAFRVADPAPPPAPLFPCQSYPPPAPRLPPDGQIFWPRRASESTASQRVT